MGTLVEGIAAAVAAERVEVAFTVPDEVTIHVVEALREAGVRVVRPRHEQHAVVMADGYARATGAPGLCAVGAGPALAQTGTGLSTAARKRSPVLVLVGSFGERWSTKAFDARRFAESTGARYSEIRGPATAAGDVREAFRLVRLREGPVVLGLPGSDVLYADVPGVWRYEPAPDVVRAIVEIDPESPAVEEAAGMLAGSRRPVVVAGRGAAEAGARAALVEVADRVGALLATTLQARGLFDGHPRAIGLVGTFATPGAAQLVAEADCILAVGASLNPFQTGGGPLAPSARTIQVDRVPTRIGEYAPVELAVVADAGAAARALAACLEAAEIDQGSYWTGGEAAPRIDEARRAPPPATASPDGRLPVPELLAALERILPADRVIVADGGHFLGFAVDAVSVPGPDSWFWTLDFSSIGLGLSVGVAAAIARPERHCVVLAGDGGFLMNVQELETAVRERVPLTIVVLNDSAYAAEARHLERRGKPRELATFDDVDLAAVARAFGARGVTVRTLDDLDEVRKQLGRREGPLLVDAKVVETAWHRSAS